MVTSSKLFSVLFDPSETITLAGPEPNRGSLFYVRDIIANYNQVDYTYYSVNPHTGPRWPRHRSDPNILAYRNIILEFDTGDFEKQLTLVKRRAIPYTALVYSGGKSLHVLISLATPCSDLEEYEGLTELVYAAIDPTFNQERSRTGLDRKCRNPGRLTRTPGIIRPETGKEQTLIDLKERVDTKTVIEFIKENQVRVDKYLKKQADKKAKRLAQRELKQLKLRKSDTLPIKDTTIALLEKGQYHGSRHDALLYAGLDLLHANYSIEEIEEKLLQASDIIGVSGRGDVAGIIKWLLTVEL